jgi:ribosomal protein L29
MFSIQELRTSTKKELLLELAKSRKENMKIRINLRTKHEKDSSKSGKMKHYIAQILTVLKDIEAEDKGKEKAHTAKSKPEPKVKADPKVKKAKSKSTK